MRGSVSLTDRSISDFHVHLAIFAHVLADAVIDHHLVVDRIADDREHGRDDVEIEDHARDREEADCHQHVVDDRDGCRDAELPFVAEPREDRDADDRQRDSQKPVIDQLARNLAGDGRIGAEGRAGEFRGQRCFHLLDQRIGGGGIGGLGQRQADGNGVLAAKLLERGFAHAQFVHRRAYFVHPRRARELLLDGDAAHEVDAQIEAARRRRADGCDGEQRSQRESDVADAHEADIGVVGHDAQRAHSDLGRPLAAQPLHREQAGEGHGREHAVTMPMISTIAKPLIGPEPSTSMMPPAMACVTFASKIVRLASL